MNPEDLLYIYVGSAPSMSHTSAQMACASPMEQQHGCHASLDSYCGSENQGHTVFQVLSMRLCGMGPENDGSYSAMLQSLSHHERDDKPRGRALRDCEPGAQESRVWLWSSVICVKR